MAWTYVSANNSLYNQSIITSLSEKKSSKAAWPNVTRDNKVVPVSEHSLKILVLHKNLINEFSRNKWAEGKKLSLCLNSQFILCLLQGIS